MLTRPSGTRVRGSARRCWRSRARSSTWRKSSTWTHVLDTYGEETTTLVFDRVFDPARIREREPYPGAPEALRALREEFDIGIHFVTHNDPETMTSRLRPWLEEHFGPDAGLTVTTGDKLEVIRELGAFGLIDDRPDTIERVADAGPVGGDQDTTVEPRPRSPQERRSRFSPLAGGPQSAAALDLLRLDPMRQPRLRPPDRGP